MLCSARPWGDGLFPAQVVRVPIGRGIGYGAVALVLGIEEPVRTDFQVPQAFDRLERLEGTAQPPDVDVAEPGSE